MTTTSKVITPIVTRENGRVKVEYLAEFEGNPIGFFSTQGQAENELNMHVIDLCENGLVDTPLALQAEQALLAANPIAPRCPTCGGEGDCPDCDTAESPTPVLVCKTCHDSGVACLDCGNLNTPAIGRKIVYLMRHDRPTLLHILRGTQPRFWPLLANAYIAALGPTQQGQTVPALGVVSLWGMLIREAA